MCVCVCGYTLGKYWQLFKLAEVLDDLICLSWMETKRHRKIMILLPSSYSSFLCDVARFFKGSFSVKALETSMLSADHTAIYRISSSRNLVGLFSV